VDILDPQNDIGDGELLGEWILFSDVVKMVDKYFDFNAFLLQGGKEETALCLLIKSDPYGSQLQVVLLQIRIKRNNAGVLFNLSRGRHFVV
jgi:hypothetical protein